MLSGLLNEDFLHSVGKVLGQIAFYLLKFFTVDLPLGILKFFLITLPVGILKFVYWMATELPTILVNAVLALVTGIFDGIRWCFV